jgi:plasmid maintenance system antidote protein VapI
MDDKRKRIVTMIRVLGIKKADLAQLADIKPCRVSEYLRNRPLSEEKTQRLENAVENIATVWTNLGIKTDLSDTEGFAKLLAYVNREFDELNRVNERTIAQTAEYAAEAERGLAQFS